jgi:chorismate dehydratase
MKPKVSVVQYLNTAPLTWGMLHGPERGHYDLAFTTPACCAEDLRVGRADIGIIPSIEVQRIGGLKVLSGMSVASKREVRSVILLSRVPISEVRSVSLDTSSRTSVALVEILLRTFYRLAPRMRPAAPLPEVMLRDSDAALLIGDPALVYRGSARSYDLAAEWRKFTGLPFVFAVWAARSSAIADGLESLRVEFERSRDGGLARLDEIADEWGPRLGIEPKDVKIYLTENIDYTLDEENLAGLRLFYKLAHEAGVISAPAELDLV